MVRDIYSPRRYAHRLEVFFRTYRHQKPKSFSVSRTQLGAFFRSLWILGVVDEGRLYFWKLLFARLLSYPSTLVVAVTMAVYGYHFRKIAESI